MGAREQRPLAVVHDRILGQLKIFKTSWETFAAVPVGERHFSISGMGKSGPTESMRHTLDFISDNIDEFCNSAVDATKREYATVMSELRCSNLHVSAIFLENEADSFDLLLECKSSEGDELDFAVTFKGKRIEEVENLH